MNETSCCKKEFEDDDCPIKWNPFNKVVQCHHCGNVYRPVTESDQLAYQWDRERSETPLE